MGVLLGFLVFAVIVWIAVKSTRSNSREAEDLQVRVTRLEREVEKLRERLAWTAAAVRRVERAPRLADEIPSAAPEPESGIPPVPPCPEAATVLARKAEPVPPIPALPKPPPLAPGDAFEHVESPEEVTQTERSYLEAAAREEKRATGEPPPAPGAGISIDWENFMGVKLFAWLGGFALFLGAAFFVKYSIEHDLISPLMRVMISFVVGAGAIAGGLLLRSRGYAVTVQALCAAGVTILYADIFAARSFYQFVSMPVAFGLMCLVTVAAFLLALRLDARSVSVLGLVGGFLTPFLLAAGEDHPIGLFGYILLLDLGLLAIALRKRWDFLAPLIAFGTLATQIGWTAKHFTPGKAETGVAIWLLFAALFLGAARVAGRRGVRTVLFDAFAAFPALTAMGFSGYLLLIPGLGLRPGLVLGFLTLLLAGVALLSLLEEGFEKIHAAASGLAFLVLLQWTVGYLSADLLPWGLAFFLAYAVLTAVFPLVLPRVRPGAATPPWAGWVPLLALLLFVGPVLKNVTGFIIWPVLLLADAAALLAAWFTGLFAAAVLVVILTFLPMAVWISTQHDVTVLPSILGVVAFFSLVLFAAGLLRLRREQGGVISASPARPATHDIGEQDLKGFAELPAVAALLPFLLLVAAVLQLRPPDPSEVFGLALLLSILLLALVRLRGADLVGLTALLSTGLVTCVWELSGRHHDPSRGLIIWFLIFTGVYLKFPFVFARTLSDRIFPWVTAALAGPVFFWPLFRESTALFGKDLIGLLPAALALPYLAGLLYLVKKLPPGPPARLAQTAWLGGATLFFVTLIFPLQFSREWITIGWALEGAALFWLYRRVPHAGLLLWGSSLLAAAFVRLALNPAVVEYHARAATPILNWYLYAYGVTAAALFAAAHLIPGDEEHRVQGISLRPALRALGTILVFLLVNIEIADYFSTGPTLTFRFSGSFAMDMAYSLAWGAFALVLLLLGIRSGNKAGRLASLGLFGATILKVFLHDLWRLGQLYRVGSIIVLAVLLILVSFLYQRYLAPELGRPRRGAGEGGSGEDSGGGE